MEKVIDCLFIGHNEMDFTGYEKEVRKMGTHSGAYRDLSLNFVFYNNIPYSPLDMFNLFYLNQEQEKKQVEPVSLGETFSAAIAYLGTYLNRRGLSFDYVNSFQDEKQDLEEKLKKNDICTIAIITTLYVSVFPILEIMDFIKKHNRTAKIIVGGPFVSTQCRIMDNQSLQYLFSTIGADIYVNSSQGEAALVKVINAFKKSLPLDGISNIYYQSENGFLQTPVCLEDNNLSRNMVDWRLFSDRLGDFAAVRTSISCPFCCAFCGFPQHAGKYQVASIEAVEQELNHLAEIKAVKRINFIDDTFNVPKQRFKEILKIMSKNRYPFKWISHFRCQYADEECVELMKTSGCEGVFLGIESGSNQVLKKMNKAVTIEQYLKGIELLKKYDILTYGSFIIGFPGETENTIKETISFIKEGGLDFFRAQLWYCDTITPIWKKKEEYQIRGSNFEWTHNGMDAKQACDWIDHIFLSIDQPVWIPQYNFEFDGFFHLLERGFSIEEVRDFLISFNQGIRERIMNPCRREISLEAVMKIKNACCQTEDIMYTLNAYHEKRTFDRSHVDFDFDI